VAAPSARALAEPPAWSGAFRRVHLRNARAARIWTWLGLVAVTVVLSPFILGCPFVWATAIAGVLGTRAARDRRWRGEASDAPTHVRVLSDGIEVEGPARATHLSRALVAEGWLEEHHGRPEACIALSDGRELRVASDGGEGAAAELAGLLRALGLSADQRVARVELGSAAASRGMGVVYHFLGPWLLCAGEAAVLLPALLAFPPPLRVLALPLALAPWILFLRDVWPGSATVGADGVTLRSPWRRRFVPLAAIAEVSTRGAHVVMTLDGAERLVLPARRLGQTGEVAGDALVTRIAQAKEAAELRDAASAAAVSALARGSRTVDAWRRDLVELVKTARDYRSQGVDVAALERVLGDAAAEPEARVGAAVALSSTAREPGAKARLRVATEAVASAPLRAAIHRALDGEVDEAELEAAAADAAPLRVTER
jgi:hypothetical protein